MIPIKRLLQRVLVMTAISVACFSLSASCMSSAGQPALSTGQSDRQPVFIVGHRGAAGLSPENTLASFARACDIGVDALELDVLLSADAQIVVHHDFRLKPHLARFPDGQWIASVSPPAINDLRLAAIKTYDVGRIKPGTRYSRRYPDQMPVDGAQIPTLREVAGLLKDRCDPSTQLWIEIKTSPEKPDLTPSPEAVSAAVVQVSRQEGILDRIRILSFDWRNLIHVQQIAPEIPTVYLSIEAARFNTIKAGHPGPSPWMAGLDIDDFSGSIPHAIQAAGGSCWAPRYKDLSGERLRAARELGLEVMVWTVDTEAAMQRILAMGVDGIITNRPDRLKAIINAKAAK